MMVRQRLIQLCCATAICGGCCAYVDAQDDFLFDATTATWFANEIAKDLEEKYPARDIDAENLDFSRAIVQSIIDGHGRRFVQVAARNRRNRDRGFEAIFEICGSSAVLLVDFIPVMYSPIVNFDQEVKHFGRARGSKDADFPHGCAELVE